MAVITSEGSDLLVCALENAFNDGRVHIVDVPIDYSENTRVLVDELRSANLARQPELVG